jgi:hypothetical protein
MLYYHKYFKFHLTIYEFIVIFLIRWIVKVVRKKKSTMTHILLARRKKKVIKIEGFGRVW